MRNVVVTTDNARRGVFSGQLCEFDKQNNVVVLEQARMAVYWSQDVRGVLGLAANGPTSQCRITPSVPRIELDGVTSVMDMTDEAVVAWQKEPWG